MIRQPIKERWSEVDHGRTYIIIYKTVLEITSFKILLNHT